MSIVIQRGGSNPLEVGECEVAVGVAGVYGGLFLEEHCQDFPGRDGFVLDAAGDDDELAGADGDVAVAQFHQHFALEDVEELVLGLVAVPDEVALEADQLDVEVVELGDDFGLPVGGEEAEFFCE